MGGHSGDIPTGPRVGLPVGDRGTGLLMPGAQVTWPPATGLYPICQPGSFPKAPAHLEEEQSLL